MQTQLIYRCWICQNTKSAIPTSNTKGNAPGAIDSGGASAIGPAQPERRIKISAQGCKEHRGCKEHDCEKRENN